MDREEIIEPSKSFRALLSILWSSSDIEVDISNSKSRSSAEVLSIIFGEDMSIHSENNYFRILWTVLRFRSTFFAFTKAFVTLAIFTSWQ